MPESTEMPQPLSRVASSAGLIVDPDTLTRFPELAALAAQAIGAWSNTELMLGNFLAKMLGISARQGITMYAALESFQPQMRALYAAATDFFEAEDKKLFDATMFVIRRAAKERNEFAHGIWGHCPELPDALLLVDAHVLWDWTAKKTEWAAEARERATPPLFDFTFDNSKVFVYKKADFRSAIGRIRKSTRYATLLAQLSPSVPSVAALIRGQLRSVPEIRSALERNSRSQTNGFSALPPLLNTTDVY